MGSEKPVRKIGVYICHCGGNIADIVNVERVAEVVAGEGVDIRRLSREIAEMEEVDVVRHFMFMCSDAGQQLIEDDIKEKGLDGIVVAACSPSLHETTFRRAIARAGLNPYLYEHVNLREQVSWAHPHDPEGATEKAIRLVRAGVVKAALLKPLEKVRVEATRHAVVIGGGIAGLRASLDLARKGIGVTLIERSPFLGGRVAQLHKLFPTEEEARPLLAKLVEEVLAEPNIDVRTYTEVIGVEGYVGDFRLRVRTQPRGVTEEITNIEAAIAACPEEADNEFDYNLTKRKAIYHPYAGCTPAIPAIDWKHCTKCGKCVEAVGGKGIVLDAEPVESEIQAGVIIVATGFTPYEPRQGEYGYGVLPEVITLPQLIRLLDPEGPTGGRLEWNGRKVRSVAFIHCVGSRQIEGLDEPGPDGSLNEYCSRVCCTATLQAANEIRERFPEVRVYDLYRDIRTYGWGHEDYYEEASKKQVLFMRYEPEAKPVVERAAQGDDYPVLVKVKDTLTFGEELEIPVDLVVLAVGMVPRDINDLVGMLKVPVGSDGFLLEVHPKLRPVESAIDGVMLAGTAQAPMDTTESTAAALAASAKAAAILSKDYVEMEPFVAKVDLSRCEGTGLCINECEYGAITLEDTVVDGKTVKRAHVNPALCKGCGACVAVCPNRAIDVQGWELKQFEAMVDAIVAEPSAILAGGGI